MMESHEQFAFLVSLLVLMWLPISILWAVRRNRAVPDYPHKFRCSEAGCVFKVEGTDMADVLTVAKGHREIFHTKETVNAG